MKKLIILTVLMCASIAGAADLGKLEDASGTIVQGPAPRGDKTVALTGASYTTDGKGMWWNVFCSSDAYFRLMPTSAKGAYLQSTIPATTWTGFVINKATPFVNISGCTGRLLRQ